MRVKTVSPHDVPGPVFQSSFLHVNGAVLFEMAGKTQMEPCETLLSKGSKLGSHFVSNELIYWTKLKDVDLKVPVTRRGWLSKYKAGRIRVELHFVLIADIHSYLSAKVQLLERPRVGRNAKYPHLHLSGLHGERSVLVDGNEPIKNPERMGLESIPSLVRLKVFDKRYRSWENVPNLVLMEAPVSADRKACLPTGTRDVKPREIPRKLIETRTKTIDKITNEQRDIYRERPALDANYMFLLSRIILSGDEVRLRFESVTQLAGNFIQVKFCSNDFQLQVS